MAAADRHPRFRMSRELQWLGDAIQSSDPGRQASALQQMIDALGYDASLSLASRNDVACILGHIAARDESHEEIREPSRCADLAGFVEAHQAVQRRTGGYLTMLDAVASALAERDIPVVALKNAGIARGIYPCAGCCPMGDVDVLVRRTDFRGAHRILVELGFQFQFRSPLEMADEELAEQSGGSEYWKQQGDGQQAWLELQWRPVAGRWIRPEQEPDGDALIDRSVPIPGSQVRLLAPEDNLLQVALHTAKHSYVRAPGFRLHTDVDRIVWGSTINWEAFVRTAWQLQVRTPVYFSLLLAHRLLGTPVPAEVLDDLAVSPAKARWIAGQLDRAGLLEPHAPKFGRWAYVTLHAALYDDWPGLWRAVFPDARWMRQRYGLQSRWQLPLGYARRAVDLAWRRVRT